MNNGNTEELSVKRVSLTAQVNAMQGILVQLRSAEATARKQTALAKTEYHDADSAPIE